METKNISVAFSAPVNDQTANHDDALNLLLECDELMGNVRALSVGEPVGGMLLADSTVLFQEALNGLDRRIKTLLEMTEC